MLTKKKKKKKKKMMMMMMMIKEEEINFTVHYKHACMHKSLQTIVINKKAAISSYTTNTTITQ